MARKTNAQMQADITAGRSVIYRGKIVTKIADLPSDAQILQDAGVSGGTHFYVDATGGSNSNSGEDWQNALATITAALALCVSGTGDTVVVRPGTYAENVVISKDYVTLQGALSGYGRPDIVPAAGLALSINNAQGVVLRGCRFACDGQDSDVARCEGNGFAIEDCVFDGDPGMGATKALLRLWCDSAIDSFTASEGRIQDCLFRQSNGYGIVFDCQNAAVGVLPTDDRVIACRFVGNAHEDIYLAATAVSVADMKRCLFERCSFESKNKATHVDLKTHKIGTANSSLFVDCWFNDDTIDTTAVKCDTTGVSLVRCASLDGVIDGDALD